MGWVWDGYGMGMGWVWVWMWELRPRSDAALVRALNLFECRIAPRRRSHRRRSHMGQAGTVLRLGVWELRPRSDAAWPQRPLVLSEI
jgi:hypothetical protein